MSPEERAKQLCSNIVMLSDYSDEPVTVEIIAGAFREAIAAANPEAG